MNNRPGTGKWIGASALAAVAFMSAWQGSLAAAEPRDPSLPLVQVAPTDEKIVIDGKMDEAVWRDLPVLGPFVTLRGDGYPVAQTEARITRTATELVIFLRCHEPTMDKVQAVAAMGEEMKLFGDDHIEFFVQGGAREEDYYHFAANSKGIRIQFMTDTKKWDGAWQAAGGTFDGGWTLEIAVPFATLGRNPQKLDSLRLNICRDRPHAMELSAWSSPRGGQFRRLERFGTLRFVEYLPLQWSVQPPPLGKASTPVLKLTCQPFAAKDVANPLQHKPEYTATVQAFSELTPVAATEQKAAFELGLSRTLSLPFTPPTGRKPSVSVTLRDSSGGVVLSTTDFPVEIVDPRREWLRQINAALEELKSSPVSAQFADRLKTWRQEAAACNEQTNGEQLRQLAQALRSVRLAATLPDGGTAAAATFVLPPFTKTAYDLIPEHVGQPLACSVFRGETASMTPNIFAFRDLSDVTVVLDDLTSGSNKLAAANFDVRLVMNWWQSSEDHSVSNTPVLIPELLVKDDAIVTLDMAKQRNVFNFDPRVGPEDPALLRPFKIPAYHNRQICLTLRTPTTQAPGTYTGKVVIHADGKAVASAPLKVTVLPVTLEPTRGAFSAYDYVKLDESLKETDPRPDIRRVPRGYYERLLALVREYGFTALPVFQDGTVKWNGTAWEVDMPLVREALRLRRQYGLVGATDYFGFMWGFGVAGEAYQAFNETIVDYDAVKPGSPSDAFLAVCRQLKVVADEEGFSRFYVYAVDEPSYRKVMAQEIALCRLIQRCGLQATSAIELKGALEVREVLARPILSPETVVVGERKPIGGLTNNPVWYGHPLEEYKRERFSTGVLTWYGGLYGRCPWMLENPWDDFEGRGMGYIYSGRNAPIPTIQLAAFRDAVGDYTLLEMLERRVAACKDRKLDTMASKALAEAEKMVRYAPKKFRIGPLDVNTKLTVGDFVEFRAELQRLIVALDAAAGSTPWAFEPDAKKKTP